MRVPLPSSWSVLSSLIEYELLSCDSHLYCNQEGVDVRFGKRRAGLGLQVTQHLTRRFATAKPIMSSHAKRRTWLPEKTQKFARRLNSSNTKCTNKQQQ